MAQQNKINVFARTSKFTKIILVVIVLVIFFLLMRIICVKPASDRKRLNCIENSDRSDRALALFATAIGQNGERIPVRREAAKQLAAHEDGVSWAILLLLENKKLSAKSDVEKKIIIDKRRFELAVLAALIQNLPKKPTKPILWALTCLLCEEERAQWGERERQFLVITSRVSYMSLPICDLARNYLKERLGVDHEYDIVAWRKEIMKMQTK